MTLVYPGTRASMTLSYDEDPCFGLASLMPFPADLRYDPVADRNDSTLNSRPLHSGRHDNFTKIVAEQVEKHEAEYETNQIADYKAEQVAGQALGQISGQAFGQVGGQAANQTSGKAARQAADQAAERVPEQIRQATFAFINLECTARVN